VSRNKKLLRLALGCGLFVGAGGVWTIHFRKAGAPKTVAHAADARRDAQGPQHLRDVLVPARHTNLAALAEVDFHTADHLQRLPSKRGGQTAVPGPETLLQNPIQ